MVVHMQDRVQRGDQWSYDDYKEKVSVFPQDYQLHLIVLDFRLELDSQ